MRQMPLHLPKTARLWMTLALVATTLAAAPRPALSQTVLKFGTANVNEGLLPLQVAIDQGFLKAEGIQAEYVNFQGGGPAVQAFVGGSIDFCVCAADHILRLASRGFDPRIIVGLDERHAYALLAKADRPYTDLASLKGKRIGITAPGSLTDNTIRWALTSAGLNAERDVEIIKAGIGASMKAALTSDQVDAGTVASTEILEFTRNGQFKIVLDWRPSPYPSLLVIGRERWVTAHPEVARGLVRAVGKAARLIQENPAIAVQSVKTLYPSYSTERAEEVAQAAKQRLTPDGSVSTAGFDTMQDIVLLSDTTLKRVNKADVDLQPNLSR
ncbi:ABC transporter substrate-binding protein [Rhodoplanes roseus]|uniref:SsuA/THI5-like domain-containing protein n=1 Tax=Rhodoplanes roseus TaxID=29409 RepID=A0A327KXL7_9BRAD|nr:ABC transporter substrate-binding protein [Rhodoplanes roseus]RAI43011.1 hypothetical protein CH341_16560 [Rhodoplanes roseus]